MNNEHPQSSTVLPFIPPRLNLGALRELTGTPVCQPSIFGTCFNHPPCIQNSNHVGIHDRLQAMSHHQHGTIFELLLKCLENGDSGSVLGMLQRFFLREPGTLFLRYLSRSIEPSTPLYLQLCHDMSTVRLILYLTYVYVSSVKI